MRSGTEWVSIRVYACVCVRVFQQSVLLILIN